MNWKLRAFSATTLTVTLASCVRQSPDTNTQKNPPAVASEARREVPANPAAPGRPWFSEPADLGQAIDWEDGQHLSIGGRSDSGNYFNAKFAVTHSENGKAAEGVWDRWELLCNELKKANPSCTLDWLSIVNVGKTPSDNHIHDRHFSSDRGEIKNLRVNWAAGTLDFSVPEEAGLLNTDVSPTEVEIKFKTVNSLLYLTDFHAVGTERDFSLDDNQRHLVTFDYRIADQTQLLTVPVLMPGLRSAGQTQWNRLVASLSETDRTEWRRLVRESRLQFNERIKPLGDELKRRARARIHDYDKVEHGGRKLTAEEDKWMDDLMPMLVTNAFRDWLATSTLSPEAQRRMVEHFDRASRARFAG